MRVLLVDDDNALASLLTSQLAAHNYIVDHVADGETGWAYASTFDYDLVVLDWMLPQLSGVHLCQRLRRQGCGVPILLLTVKNEQRNKIEGLEAGADDYVVKPFDMDELLARIRVLLRRTPHETEPVLIWGNLQLDPISTQVHYSGQLVTLTAKEYSLLELFLRSPHQVYSATVLLGKLWSSQEFPSEATVRSHLRRLRQKLSQAGAAPDLIETVHGLGYRLKSLVIDAAPTAANTDVPDQRAARYLEGLTQAWKAHKGESLARWQTLLEISQTLQMKELSEQQRTQAMQIAHSLAGTLGTFGLMEGYRLSLQVEQLLLRSGDRSRVSFSTAEAAQFHTIVTTLGHTLDEAPRLVCPVDNPPNAPKAMMIDVNGMSYVQQLMAMGIAQGIEMSVIASVEAASHSLWLDRPLKTASEFLTSLPDMVLVNLVAGETNPVLDEPILQKLLYFIQQVSERWPQIKITVITPQADFGNRLDLVRRGGVLILEYPVVPAKVLEIMCRMLELNARPSKIMIVDDDAHYLKQVVQLLHPWNFEITPLTNPQRFWTLFNQVLPDLVVFDVEMPQINGFELARVLRSHTKWQHLPIVFLSVHGDAAKQEQAFAIGADDYITKPVHGKAFATRLLNRLNQTADIRRPA
ncbi:response regulator receiver domain protein [Synechococcus sp. PCC 7335]|uniref:response regulator n=1 Tax=Synechococcus sp. (strain ATCC 29403 / PCC 7335) TaxID=91464 RepID=UPI00017ECE09|nr:response regulator [Synechococcus sp. PCC 7335]EDX86227.1 response regulator receiver domain protein [Synechococcus sp. PCC 7335]